MKPGQPLKRTSELKRTGQLKSNGRGLAKTTELKPGKRKSKAKIPAEIREAAKRRSGGRCIRCGERATQVHHVFDEQLWPELAKVVANLVGTCAQCNYDHHFKPGGRFPRYLLPPATFQLAAKLGPRAQAHLERFYPREEV